MGVLAGESERMTVETGEEMVEVATSEGPVEYRALAVSVPRRGERFKPTPVSMPLHSTYSPIFKNRLNLGVSKGLATVRV
jgi:hypothetical protein